MRGTDLEVRSARPSDAASGVCARRAGTLFVMVQQIPAFTGPPRAHGCSVAAAGTLKPG